MPHNFFTRRWHLALSSSPSGFLMFLHISYVWKGSYAESDEDEAEDSRPSIDFCDLEDDDDDDEEEEEV